MQRQPESNNQKVPPRAKYVQRQSAKSPSSSHPLIALQRSIGNTATQRLIRSPYIQAKLQISTPGDPLEQEADETADTVMRMTEPDASTQVSALASPKTHRVDEEGKIVATKAKSSRVPLAVREDEDEEKVAVQRACSHCEEEQSVQRKEEGTTPRVAGRQNTETGPTVSHETADGLVALSTGGSPLTPSTRAFFEPRFGTDFRNVRVHTGSDAARISNSVNARAFTVGNHIAFGEGEFDSESDKGRKLLAHELTHTIQQGAVNNSGAASRPNNPNEDQSGGMDPSSRALSTSKMARQHLHVTQSGTSGTRIDRDPQDAQRLHDLPLSAFRTKPHFRIAFSSIYAEAIQRMPEFEERIKAACLESIEGFNVGPGLQAIDRAAREISGISQTLIINGTDREFNIASAIKSLHELMPSNELETKLTSFGFEYIYSRLVDHSASFVAVSLQEYAHGGQIAADQGLLTVAETSDTSFTQLANDFARMLSALSDGRSVLMLELEGIIQHLVNLREEFIHSTTQEERDANLLQRSEIARRAVLINTKLMDMMDNPSAPTPLDSTVKESLASLARIAQSEEETRKALGDKTSLLAAQPLNLAERVEDPHFAESGLSDEATARQISPALAFPKTDERFMAEAHYELAERINRQSNALQDQLNKIVPPHSAAKYTLKEFAEVYKHWFGLFGLEAEKEAIRGSGALDIWAGIHKATAIGTLSVSGDVMTAMLRYTTMQQALPLLGMMVGGSLDREFDAVAARQQLRRSEGLSGTKASDARYEFSELYGQGNRTGAAEEMSRANLASQKAETTSQEFTSVAKLPSAFQSYVAFHRGLTPQALPVLNLRTVEAKEGWSYLIAVPQYPTGTTIAYEHKVATPEVADYLLAHRQHAKTLKHEHSITVPVRSPQKDTYSVVPKTAGSGAGSFEAGKSSQRGNLERADVAARSAIGMPARGGQGIAATGTELLAATLLRYLNHYFQQAPPELRVASIFHIMNVEHNIGKVFDKMFDPAEIAKVLAKAFGISFGLGILSGLGPIGKALSLGIGKALKVIGGSDITSALTVAGYLKEAGSVESFVRARMMGYIGLPILSDIQQLFESMISLPVSMVGHRAGEAAVKTIIDRINLKPPTTIAEAAAIARQLGDASPEARKEMLDAVESYLADVKAAQALGKDISNKDYEMMMAFRDALQAQTRVDQILDPFKTKLEFKKPDPKTTPFIDTDFRLRTPTERAKLLKAMGGLAGKVPLVEDPTLSGATVKVHYLDGQVRLHVGKEATATDVALHMPTVNTLRKYEGFTGTLRIILERALNMLAFTKTPQYGSRGREAELEIAKLENIQKSLLDQLDAMDLNARKLIDNEIKREVIEQHLLDINRQILENMRDLDSMEVGVGFIAARKTSAGAVKAGSLKLGDPPTGHFWREREGQLELVQHDKKADGFFLNQEILKAEQDKINRGEPGDLKRAIRPISEQGSAGLLKARELGLEGATPSGHVWRLDPTGSLMLVKIDSKAPGHKWFDYASYVQAQGKGKASDFIKDISEKADSNSDSAVFTAKNWEEAYNDLGGNGTTTSFGKFRKVLEEEFKVTKVEIIERMKQMPKGGERGPSPEGLGIRNIRHSTKEHYVDTVIMKHLTDEATLTQSPRYQAMIAAGKPAREALIAASHERLLAITRELDSADKGGLGEKWYTAWFANTGDRTQFSISKQDIANRYPGVDLKQDRNIDLFQKVNATESDIVEIKNVSGTLNEPRLKSELQAHLDLRGKDVRDGSTVTTVRNVVWVLLDPATLKDSGTQAFILRHLQFGVEFRLQTPEGTIQITSVNIMQVASQFAGVK